MARPKQNPEDSVKRARILEVAAQMFLEQGFSRVSMDAIAEAAPVSKPTLYSHFKDKEDLFIAVIAPRCQAMFQSFEKRIATEDRIEDALYQIGIGFMDLVLSPEAISVHRTILGETQAFPALGQLFYETGPKKSLEILSAYLKKKQEEGQIKETDPVAAASMFISMLKGFPHMQILLGVRKTVSQKERENHVRYVVEIFLNGHRA